MTAQPTPRDLECTADTRGRCAVMNKTVEVLDERDDRNLCKVTCDDCDNQARVVVGSSFDNINDILAIDGDMEER